MVFKVLIPPTHTITAPVSQDVLAGYFVKSMSITDVLTTDDWESHIYVDKCDAAADRAYVVGLALGSAISGTKVAIATDGLFTHLTTFAVAAGQEVGADQTDPLAICAASYTCTGSTNALQYIKPIGTSWSTAASGEQCIFKLNL